MAKKKKATKPMARPGLDLVAFARGTSSDGMASDKEVKYQRPNGPLIVSLPFMEQEIRRAAKGAQLHKQEMIQPRDIPESARRVFFLEKYPKIKGAGYFEADTYVSGESKDKPSLRKLPEPFQIGSRVKIGRTTYVFVSADPAPVGGRIVFAKESYLKKTGPKTQSRGGKKLPQLPRGLALKGRQKEIALSQPEPGRYPGGAILVPGVETNRKLAELYAKSKEISKFPKSVTRAYFLRDIGGGLAIFEPAPGYSHGTLKDLPSPFRIGGKVKIGRTEYVFAATDPSSLGSVLWLVKASALGK